jgi:hypothetical protein
MVLGRKSLKRLFLKKNGKNSYSSINSSDNNSNNNNNSSRESSEDSLLNTNSTTTTAIMTTATSSTSDAVAAAASVNTSNHVYVMSDDSSWVPARLLELHADTATVSIPIYRDEQSIQSDGGRAAYKSQEKTIQLVGGTSLLLQNVNEDGRLIEVNDMVDLPFLHEVCTA